LIYKDARTKEISFPLGGIIGGVRGVSHDGERLVFDAPVRVEAGASLEIAVHVA
jgi:hypothetical protein